MNIAPRPLIEGREVRKQFRSRSGAFLEALTDTSLAVQPKQFVCIVAGCAGGVHPVQAAQALLVRLQHEEQGAVTRALPGSQLTGRQRELPPRSVFAEYEVLQICLVRRRNIVRAVFSC